MPLLEFETTVPAPLARVWAFFNDPVANLAGVYPSSHRIQVESAKMPLEKGSQVVLQMKGPLGKRVRWMLRIIEHEPPHDVMFGQEARFVDQEESGFMAHWPHEHEFEATGDSETRIVDRIDYRLPWSVLGWIADLLIVRRRIKATFRHSRQVLEKWGKP